MKFTEEQYQKIVEMFEKVNEGYNMGFLNPNIVTFFQEKLYKEFDSILYFVEDWQTIAAFANPLTREWAHEQYVEKEKKYVWRDKYTGYVIYKMLNDWSLSATALGEKHFTETELENSPFKPEWFTKEEVE